MEFLFGLAIGAAATGVAAAFLFWRQTRRHRSAARAAEGRVRHAEQRAAAGRLAGGLIHEIKNPLNTLSLNLQLLAEDYEADDSQEAQRALRRVRRLMAETDRLNAILKDFMGFVRDRKLELVPCDLNELVGDLATFVTPELESKGIQLRASFGDAPRCRVDVNLLKQALLNLIINAEDALAQCPNREIMLRTQRDGDMARIDVIDTGAGIPEEDREKIFEAFYSTRKSGTGLGLPTTRRIVEEHGGTIALHSDHGQGSCFTIRLPASGDAAEPEEAR